MSEMSALSGTGKGRCQGDADAGPQWIRLKRHPWFAVEVSTNRYSDMHGNVTKRHDGGRLVG